MTLLIDGKLDWILFFLCFQIYETKKSYIVNLLYFLSLYKLATYLKSKMIKDFILNVVS